ncbi:MAG: PD-(D/E)XK nuclease family protein [Candidatus Omnitrophica bacterium]|nr:PD-(D/E)XK nuclease family protein [Candidatus Omnitrophota bacterium]
MKAAAFQNTFSWSKSRDELFRECHRKYYYDKYGFWEGWRRDADPERREIYLLKQVKSRRMWMGEKVHAAVENALKTLMGGAEASREAVIQELTDVMRRDFRLSRAGAYEGDPKRVTALFEHVYALPVSDEEWVRLHETAVRSVQEFFASDILKRARAAGIEHWLPVEEMQSFSFEGIPVYVKLDFAFREGGGIVIVDWKTGMGEDVDVTVQLGCYALYASERWAARPRDIEAIEYNLNTRSIKRVEIVEAHLEWARHYIRNSVQAMRKMLADPQANTARIEDFERVSDRTKCKWCNFRRVCLPDVTF